MNLVVSFFINGHLRESKQITTPCTIGRSSQSDWVLTHPMLSREHCVLTDKGEELYLFDVGSLNGTVFKGILVKEPVRLQFGDEFTVGDDLKFLVQPPGKSEHGTDKLEIVGQTTVVYTLDEMNLHQSTLLAAGK